MLYTGNKRTVQASTICPSQESHYVTCYDKDVHHRITAKHTTTSLIFQLINKNHNIMHMITIRITVFMCFISWLLYHRAASPHHLTWANHCFLGQWRHLVSGGATLTSMATKTSCVILHGYGAVSSTRRGDDVT